MGTLFVVSTPIGNLEDITIRAIKTLFSVDAIACEDTRRAGMLMKQLYERYSNAFPEIKDRYQKQRLLSYYEQTEDQRIPEIINALKNGLDIALISDAGTPLVSDPGFPLIRECVREDINIVSIPGASSILPALTSSGLPMDKFMFIGYPPHKPGHRIKLWQNITLMIRIIKVTVIVFEAPHKLVRTLDEMKEVFGDIDIVLTRELTKVHEEVWRGSISEALKKFGKIQKGEFVILFTVTNSEI